jgi:small subunit ribosomal protein S14
MTTSNWRKMFTQLDNKPVTKAKYIKHNAKRMRSCGRTTKECFNCGTHRAFNGKYGINLCRRCFRDHAQSLNFKKYS